MTPKSVANIHHVGGTVLGSSRGGFDRKKIVDAIVEKGINQVYCIGGDGTHRGAQEIFDEIKQRNLKVKLYTRHIVILYRFQLDVYRRLSTMTSS
jgi:6-phosphofructokinase 1